MRKHIEAGVLDIAYDEYGRRDGWPVFLLHGFPYDVHAYDEVAPRLTTEGARVIVPYLRGYGPTRFLIPETPRSGQQAALGLDLLKLMEALDTQRAVLAGYDWGGRAACIVAALWPERVLGLVSGDGYNIQNIAAAGEPDVPENEFRHWYQYYFHGDRGRKGLEQNRVSFCRLLWSLWSPNWAFDDATFARTAPSFDNPDFVEVVIQSYRHRFGLAAGDPALSGIERQLAGQPQIGVPTITLDGETDGVMKIGGTASHAKHFAGKHQHRVIIGAGHNLPQERPDVFAEVIQAVRSWAAR